jgi:DNA-binding protein HU-beta
MTKIEMVEQLSEKTGLQKKDAEKTLEIFISIVQDSLKRGEKVNLAGLGTFIVTNKRARKARNPKTGASVEVGPKRAVKFKPGKQIKEILASIPQGT